MGLFWGGESLLFNIAPKCSAEVLPRDPQCNKVVIHLMEKIRVLDEVSFKYVIVLLTVSSVLIN